METQFLFREFVRLPYLFLNFWYLDAPANLVNFFGNVLSAFAHFFSLSLILRTFFRPWKNERRRGYFWYAVGLAVVARLVFLSLGLVVLAVIGIFAIFVILFWLIFPLLSILLIFAPNLIYG